MSQLDEIFMHYDSFALKEADPEKLISAVTKNRCGNRAIAKQMHALRQNIQTLESLTDVDAFVTSAAPEKIAKIFSQGPTFKLAQIGFPLAMEYLRNVGVSAIKPDVHICRIVGPSRLALTKVSPSPEQAFHALMDWSKQTGSSAMYIDSLLWLFAAKDYGNICRQDPRCQICHVQKCMQRHRLK